MLGDREYHWLKAMESPQHDKKISAYECVCVIADLEGDVQHGWLLHISVTLTAVIAVMGCVRLIDLTVSVCVWSHVTAQSLTNQSSLTLQGQFWQKHDLCLIHTNTYALPRSVKVNAEDMLCALVNPFCSVPESVKEVWSSAFTLISHSCLPFISPLDFWILIPSAVHQFEECIKLNDEWKDCFVLQEGIHQYVWTLIFYKCFENN